MLRSYGEAFQESQVLEWVLIRKTELLTRFAKDYMTFLRWRVWRSGSPDKVREGEALQVKGDIHFVQSSEELSGHGRLQP